MDQAIIPRSEDFDGRRGENVSSDAARVSSRRLGNGEEPHSLEDVLTRILEIEKKGDDEGGVSVANIVDAVGSRSFGPLLLVPGVVMLSPLSGIPTLPTVCASFVALVAVQMLSGRRCLWLPNRIAGLSVNPNRLARAMEFLLPMARFGDRLFKPRLLALTRGVFALAVPALCLLLALTVPFLEILPFASSATGAAITLLALALVVRDGLLNGLAFVFSAGAIVLGMKTWL